MSSFEAQGTAGPSPQPRLSAGRPLPYTTLLDGGAAALLLVGVLVHLLFFVSLRTGWLNPLFNDSMHRFGPGCDFFSIYAAGVKARLGESVYTIGGHVEQVPYAYAFRYAPAVAYTLGALLSLLPAITSYGAWLLVCELALLRNIRLTLGLAPDRRTGCVAAALWLLFSPYYLELYVGQFTFITASLVFWAYLAWERKRGPAAADPEGEAGPRWRRRLGDGCYAFAVLLKMMPLLYLPLALLRGRWKGVLVTGAVLIGSSWAYFAAYPADWSVFTATNGDPRPTWHGGNQGLMALLLAVTGEQVRPYLALRAVAMVVVGLGLAALTYRAWGAERVPPPGTESRDSASLPPALALYAACTAAYLLLYKDVWEHHYVLLLPPLVLLALRGARRMLWLPPFLICALPGLFALYDVPAIGYNEDPQRYWQPAVSLLHHGWKPLGPLWLFAALLVHAFRRAQPVAHRTAASGNAPVARPARRWATAVVALLLLGALVGAGRWADAAIREQKQVTRQLVWSEEVFQRQQRPEACGPAALAAVCRYFGLPAAEEEMARLAGTTERGTSMLGLQRAARARGLAAYARRVDAEELRRLPRPAILFFHQGHFAVLTGVQGRRYYIADPSLGQHTWSEGRLRRYWRGEVLIVGPAEP